jgi:hypothetical protein
MKRRNQHGSAEHGVHLATIEESFPGRDGIEVSRREVDDDISMVAMAGGARKQSTISSLTGMPSVQEAQCEDAPVSRKDIRRLYVLVCAALVLVLVGIIVAVSLSLTIGKQPVPATVDNSNNTAPTPTVDTTPSPSPVNGATVPPGINEVSFGGTFSSETGTQDPIEASTTTTLVNDGSLPPSSTRTMGEQLLDSPPQTLPPIREDPAPSPAPPDSRRAEQQREEKSLHYLRGN